MFLMVLIVVEHVCFTRGCKMVVLMGFTGGSHDYNGDSNQNGGFHGGSKDYDKWWVYWWL